LPYWFKATGTGQLQLCRQIPFQADVFYNLVLAVMLLDQVRMPRGLQGHFLLNVPAKVDHTRTNLLPEIQRTKFSLSNTEEHGNLRRPIKIPRRPRKHAQRRKFSREQ